MSDERWQDLLSRRGRFDFSASPQTLGAGRPKLSTQRAGEAAAKFDQAELVCYALEGLAASLIKSGRSLVRSVQLIGAAAASRLRLGTTIHEGPETEIMRQTRIAASLALGEDAFKDALAQGAKIELSQAVALARSLD